MNQPVTLMVARRVAAGQYDAFLVWLREGEALATGHPGYLGSGVLTPPPGDNLVQIVFRFACPQTLDAWEHSDTRRLWLERGQGLFEAPLARSSQRRRVSECSQASRVWGQAKRKTICTRLSPGGGVRTPEPR